MDAETAFQLESQVVAARRFERQSWVPLAAALASFHANQAWKELGREKFTVWLAEPEISMGPRHAYRLIAVWSWAQDNGIPDEQLAACDVTKLAAVLPVIQRDPDALDIDQVLDDVQALSRSDLKAKYGQEPEPRAKRETTECEQCGRQVLIPAEN